ncbi:MAG: hypothetical protein IJ733_02625, partial [Lachnospiraceae bacterium]|nr:hypothetical protein [Lachnospiraceae bacterium]
TKIIINEMISVTLDIYLHGKRVLITRKFFSNIIFVSEDENQYKLQAKSHKKFVEGGEMQTISDYFYQSIGQKPIEMVGKKTAKGKKITFSNFMWYSYFRQDELDNTIFYLGDNAINIKSYTSSHVMKILLNNQDVFKSDIIKQLHMLTDKETNMKYKIGICDELLRNSDVFDKNINDELFKKSKIVSDLKQSLKEIDFNNISEDEFMSICTEERKLGYYEAEIIYLKEFSKLIDRRNIYKKMFDKCKEEIGQLDYFISGSPVEFEYNVLRLEKTFGECLINIQFPDYDSTDYVKINYNSFSPSVRDRNGNFKYDYHTISSGGIRTIFKICYGLAIHIYLAENDIQSMVPNILMIDTPMKNINERIDYAIYERLYLYLYQLFSEGGKTIWFSIDNC